MINIAKLYTAGVKQLTETHAAKEVTKVGEFRGGNSGIIALGGKVVGACGRLSYLRWKGITGVDEPEDSKKLMFEAGIANEDIWSDILTLGMDVLKEELPEGLVLRREEEIPIRWQLPSGTQVSGRPDIVVCRTERGTESKNIHGAATWSERYIPVLGIELKLVSSLWTGREVGIELEPKLNHLLQGGHYAWALGQQVLAGLYGPCDSSHVVNGAIPYELWYTNRAEFAIGSGWEQGVFPKPVGAVNPRLERGTSKDRQGNTKPTNKKLLQFRQGYKLEFTPQGQLKYCVLGEDGTQVSGWHMTPITISGLKRYFEAVEAQDQSGPMPPPTVLKSDGNEGSYSACDYCELKKICKSADKQIKAGKVSMKEWVEQVLSR